jgi:hypothetical protein
VLGAAAWHLGVSAPEQGRQLLLALTKIKAIIRSAQCAAVVSISVGKYSCFAGYVHAVVTVRKQKEQGLSTLTQCAIGKGALKDCTDIQVSWRDQLWRA